MAKKARNARNCQNGVVRNCQKWPTMARNKPRRAKIGKIDKMAENAHKSP